MAKRILIADDSLTIQKAFAMTFGGEDATLVAARSADEGLTLARQSRPDLVIADAAMPGRTGYDLCAAIKSDPALRGVPVYILASTQNPYDEARGRQSGVDGQLTKPFEAVALVDRVKEAIAKGASAVPLVAAPFAASSAAARPPLAAVVSPPGMPGMPNRPSAPPLRSMPPASADDDYGEISIAPFGDAEPSRPAAGRSLSASAAELTPPPAAPFAQAQAHARSPSVAAPPANPPGAMRPSLIPGLRPGAVTAARPVPMRPASLPGSPGQPPAANLPGSVPPHAPNASPPLAARGPGAPASPAPARTLMGLPAVVAHPPARFGAPTAPARPVVQPVAPMSPTLPVDARTPAPAFHNPATPGIAPATAALTSKVDQKIAAIAAKGPEYEVIAKLSREIIEKIVWEIVPELAEVIVREELQKRGRI